MSKRESEAAFYKESSDYANRLVGEKKITQGRCPAHRGFRRHLSSGANARVSFEEAYKELSRFDVWRRAQGGGRRPDPARRCRDPRCSGRERAQQVGASGANGRSLRFLTRLLIKLLGRSAALPSTEILGRRWTQRPPESELTDARS